MTVSEALAKVCPDTRPGENLDAVHGVVPAHVAAPATIAEACDVMRAAADHRLAVISRGAGTTIRQGPPPERCDLIVDTKNLNRVIEHAAGDLVVKVEAGRRLPDLQDALAAKGQRLVVESGGTVGGAIAARAAGPLSHLYGTVRDLLIGITIVRADGVLAHAGGKVVKNVAGYDLGKLFTGSRGTLGLIVEAAFRLHPLPRAVAYVTATAADANAAHAMTQALTHSPLVPAAIEVGAPAGASDGGDIAVAALFEGVPAGVAARAASAVEALDLHGGNARITEAPPPWWGRTPVKSAPAELPPAAEKLMWSVKDRFDPDHRLSPGREPWL